MNRYDDDLNYDLVDDFKINIVDYFKYEVLQEKEYLMDESNDPIELDKMNDYILQKKSYSIKHIIDDEMLINFFIIKYIRSGVDNLYINANVLDEKFIKLFNENEEDMGLEVTARFDIMIIIKLINTITKIFHKYGQKSKTKEKLDGIIPKEKIDSFIKSWENNDPIDGTVSYCEMIKKLFNDL